MANLQIYIESNDPEIMDSIRWIHDLDLIDNLQISGELLVFLGIMFQKKAAVYKSRTSKRKKLPVDKLL